MTITALILAAIALILVFAVNRAAIYKYHELKDRLDHVESVRQTDRAALRSHIAIEQAKEAYARRGLIVDVRKKD